MSSVVLFRLREANAIVGIVEDKTDTTWLLSRIAVIRRWGTTKGFPELCAGPTKATVLDVAEKMPLHTLAVVGSGQIIYAMPANEAAWKKVLE